MKRILALLLALIMALSSLPAMADGAEDDTAIWAVVRSYTAQPQRIRMYTDADMQSDVVAEVYSGVFVRLLEEEGSFVKVFFGLDEENGLTGYIPAANIDRTHGFVTAQTPVLTVRNTAGGTGITLRSAPVNHADNAYGVLPNGAQVLLLAVVPDQSWYYVQYGGITAFAARYGFSWYNGSASAETEQQPDADDEDKTEHAFYGPSGNYVTGDWSYMTPDNVAVVNNPKQAERLHLREGPSYSSQSLGRYYNGTRVEVLDKSNAEWTKVRIGILEGYMRTEYLDFEYPFPISGMPIMEICNPGVLANMKLRLEPDMNAAYDGVYKNGTKVLMIGFAPGWAHVIVDGKMGFMRTEFLK